MLGKRAPRDSKPQQKKKRKWEEDDDDSEGEAKITKEDLEKWEATMREEEKQERLAKEKQENEEREKVRKAKEAEEEKIKLEQEEENRAQKEAAEVRKLAEERENALRKSEDIAAPGALPPDVGGRLPPGMNPSKMHLYKSSYCKRWEQGNCNFGAACHFAHGDRDLRGNRPLHPLGAQRPPGVPAGGALAPAAVMPPPAAAVLAGLHVPVHAPGVPAHFGAMRPPTGQVVMPPMRPEQATRPQGQVVLPPIRPDQAAAALDQMWESMMAKGADGKGQAQAQGGWPGSGPPGPAPGAWPSNAPPSGPPQWDAWPSSAPADASWHQPGTDASWQMPGADASWQGGDASWHQPPGGGGDASWHQPPGGGGGGAPAPWNLPGGSAGW